MKATILNGSFNDDTVLEIIHKTVIQELKDIEWEVIPFILRDLKITICRGCFECWMKTPGICRFDDAGREIAKSFIQSDLVIFLTPVTFGGYSSELKKALDRIICLDLPFFKKYSGEVHHLMRYEKYPCFMVVGVLPEKDKESERIFKTLVERNALNFFPPAYVSGFIYRYQSQEEIQKKIETLLGVTKTISTLKN